MVPIKNQEGWLGGREGGYISFGWSGSKAASFSTSLPTSTPCSGCPPPAVPATVVAVCLTPAGDGCLPPPPPPSPSPPLSSSSENAGPPLSLITCRITQYYCWRVYCGNTIIITIILHEIKWPAWCTGYHAASASKHSSWIKLMTDNSQRYYTILLHAK